METNELKNIWNTLADEKIIGKELAEENIERIISTQSRRIINKLNKRTKRNGIIYGAALLFTIIATLYVQIDLGKLFPANTYLGIIVIVGFLLLNMLRDISKSAVIKRNYNTDSIKDSLINIKMYLTKVIRIDFYIGLIFSICMLIIYTSKYIFDIGGFNHVKFSGNDLIVHSPYFVLAIIIMLLASPWWLKKELKLKFSNIQKDIENSLKELEEL
jgi:hypothetical protein